MKPTARPTDVGAPPAKPRWRNSAIFVAFCVTSIFLAACDRFPGVPPGGSTNGVNTPDAGNAAVDAGPPGFELVIKAAAVTDCADWTSSVPAEISTQTPRELRLGVLGVELLRAVHDPAPVPLVTAAAPDELDLDDGPELARVDTATLPAGRFSHVRATLAYVIYKVSGTAHVSGYGAVPGDVEFDVALSDYSASGGARAQGSYRSTFSAFGRTESFQGNLPLNCPLSRGGGLPTTANGRFTATVPLPGGAVEMRQARAGPVELVLTFPMDDSFRWNDVAMTGYSAGVLDLSAPPAVSDSVVALAICDLLMADRCAGGWSDNAGHRRATWPMPDSATRLCAGPDVTPDSCPAGDGLLDGQDGTYLIDAPSYTATQDTVADGVTGLVWQRSVPPDTTDWWEAKSYCQELGLGGFDDWRLPTRIELVSLLDLGRSDPTIDVAAFPGSPPDFFWSSSPLPFSGLAYGVRFEQGFTYDHDPATSGRVRCVRGGGIAAQVQFTTADDTVSDEATGLTWQRAMGPAALDWKDSLAYCQTLQLGGRGDWRLPSVKEMQTIVEEEKAAPSIDLVAFPDTPAEWFWTSSPTAQPHGYAWGISFTDGYSTPNANTSLFRVRCVAGRN